MTESIQVIDDPWKVTPPDISQLMAPCCQPVKKQPKPHGSKPQKHKCVPSNNANVPSKNTNALNGWPPKLRALGIDPDTA